MKCTISTKSTAITKKNPFKICRSIENKQVKCNDISLSKNLYISV